MREYVIHKAARPYINHLMLESDKKTVQLTNRHHFHQQHIESLGLHNVQSFDSVYKVERTHGKGQ